MYGVVLWSDETCGKAVIWCDDHGDLAFYSGTDQALRLEVGDMVQLSTRRDRRIRIVQNVSVIAQGQAPQLAEKLQDVSSRLGDGAEVVSFPVKRKKAALPEQKAAS